MASTVQHRVGHMDIDPATAAGTSAYNGQMYYFCSIVCKKTFDKKPKKHLGNADEYQHNHEI